MPEPIDTTESEWLAAYYAEYERNRPALVMNIATSNANPDEETEYAESPNA